MVIIQFFIEGIYIDKSTKQEVIDKMNLITNKDDSWYNFLTSMLTKKDKNLDRTFKLKFLDYNLTSYISATGLMNSFEIN